MSFWTPDNIRSSCGGSWAVRPRAVFHQPLAGVSTDSRSTRPGEVFIALRGERFDGHDYLEAAIAAGSPLLIVHNDETARRAEEASSAAGAGIVRVADTGKALLRLAAAYRRTLDKTRVIAIGGSNGKTTTTRLVHAVLASSLRGTASAKSFNNAVGVPLTILSASPNDQFLICEVGTNAPGEIAQLASVIEPDIAVIASIGREHLEGFGSLQGVAREEAALLSFLRPGGFAVVTADAPAAATLNEYLKGVPNVVRFGFSPDADLRASDVAHVLEPGDAIAGLGLRFRINGRTECRLRLLGEHNAANALAAWAVGRRLGLEPACIVAALQRAKGPEMRLEPLAIATGSDPVVVINDAYNANPDSMLASLRAFAGIGDCLAAGGIGVRRRVAVLGDMLELGAASEASHREIGAGARDAGALDTLVLAGELMNRWALPEAPGAIGEPGGDGAAVSRIAALVRPGDLVLLKGSRLMRLERVVEALRQRWGATVSLGAAGGRGAACGT